MLFKDSWQQMLLVSWKLNFIYKLLLAIIKHIYNCMILLLQLS